MTIFSGLVWPEQWRRCHTIWRRHGIILGSPGGCSTQMSNAIEKLTSNTGSKLTFNICHSFYCLKLIMCLESVTSHYFVTAFNMTTSRFWVQLTKNNTGEYTLEMIWTNHNSLVFALFELLPNIFNRKNFFEVTKQTNMSTRPSISSRGQSSGSKSSISPPLV